MSNAFIFFTPSLFFFFFFHQPTSISGPVCNYQCVNNYKTTKKLKKVYNNTILIKQSRFRYSKEASADGFYLYYWTLHYSSRLLFKIKFLLDYWLQKMSMQVEREKRRVTGVFCCESYFEVRKHVTRSLSLSSDVICQV